MAAEHQFEEKGKVKPKTAPEPETPQKENSPITTEKMQGKLDVDTVRQMQQTVGNTAVQRFLAQRSGEGPTELDEDTAGNINRQRGEGQNLDEGMAAKAGTTMGQDFSDVKVHTDTRADDLSQDLGAKAFTTGNDIFFREGEYNPGNSSGQELIAHELTHVVQQGAATPAVQGKMTVNDPNDQFEAEADQVADTVMTQTDDLQRQEEEELQMQVEEEEEEEVQMQEEEEDVQMQEEEELQMQEEEEDVQMQELEVQRQEEEEEPPV